MDNNNNDFTLDDSLIEIIKTKLDKADIQTGISNVFLKDHLKKDEGDKRFVITSITLPVFFHTFLNFKLGSEVSADGTINETLSNLAFVSKKDNSWFTIGFDTKLYSELSGMLIEKLRENHDENETPKFVSDNGNVDNNLYVIENKKAQTKGYLNLTPKVSSENLSLRGSIKIIERSMTGDPHINFLEILNIDLNTYKKNNMLKDLL